ncbi:MAG: hypothetical protein ACYS21_09460, partial [Planctomycetota bacterium]
EEGNLVTSVTSITIMGAGTSTNLTLYADSQGNTTITNPVTSTSYLRGGVLAFYIDRSTYKATVTDGTDSLTIDNITANPYKFPFYTRFISSMSNYSLGDANDFVLGSDSDWTGECDTAKTLEWLPLVDASMFVIGNGTADSDFKVFCGAVGDYFLVDEGLAMVQFVDVDVEMDDDAYFYIGTDSDVSIKFDNSGDDLDILHDDGEIAFGADGAGPTVIFHTETSGSYVQIDEDNAELDVTNVTLKMSDSYDIAIGDGADITIGFDGATFKMDAILADEAWYIGDTTTGFDLTYYFEGAGTFRTDYDGDFVNLTDDMDLRLGTGASTNGDFQISSNSSNVLAIEQVVADTGTMTIGADGTDIPTTFYAETTGDFFRVTGDDVHLEDVSLCLAEGTELQFGDALGTGDMKISCTSNVLAIEQVVADTGTVTLGADGTDIPTTFYAETTGDFLKITGDDVQLEDVSLCLAESTQIQFGDALGTGDMTLSCASNLLTIGQVVAGTGAVALGVDDAGVDLTFYGDTASQKAWWDASGDEWFFGADAEGVDVTFYGDTASSYAKWDENSGTNGAFLFEAADIALGDGDQILLGDTLGTGDFTISSTSAVLTIAQVAADTGTITIGASGTDVPITWNAETAAAEITLTGDTATFDGVDIIVNDDDLVAFGDGSEGTLQYDEDGENAVQWTGTVYGAKRLVEHLTASDTLTNTESGKVFYVSLAGAGAAADEVITLPTAEAGLEYIIIDANETAVADVTITAGASDKIQNGNAAGSYVHDTDADKMAMCHLVAIDDEHWVVISETGTWAAE